MTQRGRRFVIEELIGAGGFGKVYRATMHAPGGFQKRVALKFLDPSHLENPEIAQRFRDEARILGMLHHRAIVRVDGLVDLNGQEVVVMEHVDGLPLSTVIQNGPVPARAALEVVAEVAAGLHAGWSEPGPGGDPMGLIHRDIKPDNILVSWSGEAKLLDFGTAKAEIATREAATQDLRMGTLMYMAPENLDPSLPRVDAPALDAYGLGVTLYEMLAAQPFGPPSPKAARHWDLLEKRVEALRRQLANDGEDADRIVQLVEDCLAYAPQERPSAQEVCDRASELTRRSGSLSLSRLLTELRQAGVKTRSSAALSDPLVGEVFTEHLAPPASDGIAPSQDDPERSEQMLPRWAMAGIPLLLLLLVGGAGGTYIGLRWFFGPRQPSEPVAPADIDDVQATPEAPTVAPEPEMGPEPELPSEPTPTVEDAPAPAPTRAPAAVPDPPTVEAPAPAPQVEPEPPVTRIAIDFQMQEPLEYELRSEAGTVVSPGDVPPGKYTVMLRYPGDRRLEPGGSVSVDSGESVRMLCLGNVQSCRQQ